MLIKLGVIPICGSMASSFSFNLLTRNRLFYFWFLPLSRILRMGYSVLVYCNTFFRGAKPPRWRSFHHFGQRYPTPSRCFVFHVFSHSIQSFMGFRLILGLLLIYIWTTSDRARLFSIYKRSFSCLDSKSGSMTTALLESAEGENDCRKYSWSISIKKNVADLDTGRTRDLLVSSQTHPT